MIGGGTEMIYLNLAFYTVLILYVIFWREDSFQRRSLELKEERFSRETRSSASWSRRPRYGIRHCLPLAQGRACDDDGAMAEGRG